MLKLLSSIITLILISSACGNSSESENRDAGKLIGEWIVVKWVSNGSELEVKQNTRITANFRKDGVHITTGHMEDGSTTEVSKEYWQLQSNNILHFYSNKDEIGIKNAESLSVYSYHFNSDTLVLEGTFGGQHDIISYLPHAKKEIEL